MRAPEIDEPPPQPSVEPLGIEAQMSDGPPAPPDVLLEPPRRTAKPMVMLRARLLDTSSAEIQLQADQPVVYARRRLAAAFGRPDGQLRLLHDARPVHDAERAGSFAGKELQASWVQASDPQCFEVQLGAPRDGEPLGFEYIWAGDGSNSLAVMDVLRCPSAVSRWNWSAERAQGRMTLQRGDRVVSVAGVAGNRSAMEQLLLGLAVPSQSEAVIFEVEWEVRNRRLGIALDSHMEVVGIDEAGLVVLHNRRHPEQAIRIGDHFLEVNSHAVPSVEQLDRLLNVQGSPDVIKAKFRRNLGALLEVERWPSNYKVSLQRQELSDKLGMQLELVQKTDGVQKAKVLRIGGIRGGLLGAWNESAVQETRFSDIVLPGTEIELVGEVSGDLEQMREAILSNLRVELTLRRLDPGVLKRLALSENGR